MTLSLAQGTVDYSGILVPTIKSKQFWYQLTCKTVLPRITVSDIQGAENLKKEGDTVEVPILPIPTSAETTIGQDFDYEEQTPELRTFHVNRVRTSAFKLNRVQAAQFLSGYKGMADQMQAGSTSEQARAIEKQMFELWLADANSDNSGAAAGLQKHNINLGTALAPLTTINSTGLVQLLRKMRVVAEQGNWPDEEQYVVLDPDYASLLLMAGNLSNASFSGDPSSSLLTSVLKQGGEVRKVCGFTIYCSNQIYNAGGLVYPIFGCKSACGWVSQWQEARMLQEKGNHYWYYDQSILHDGWVLRPEMFGYAVLNEDPAAES